MKMKIDEKKKKKVLYECWFAKRREENKGIGLEQLKVESFGSGTCVG